MPTAAGSGSDANATPNGTAKSRDHNQGNQDRKYTIEQKTAVIRVRKCQATAFYEILALEKTASDAEIKKAYRKLSLLTHPDKNGYEGADEAFKMVSRAFQILSDAEKKTKYDQFGGDPDNRFGSGAAASSPFSGFTRSPGRGPMYEDEISPEELFRQFFGGGVGGGFGGPFGGMGGGMFDAGPQFVFNVGGGPGFRVHQFGGNRPRRRPDGAAGEQQAAPSGMNLLTSLVPIILLFVLPLLSSLFSSSGPSGPTYRFDAAVPPHTQLRTTPHYKINYYINPNDVTEYNPRKFSQLDLTAERDYVNTLRDECEAEQRYRERMLQEAQGWFLPDVEKMKQARSLELRSCKRLEELGTRRD